MSAKLPEVFNICPKIKHSIDGFQTIIYANFCVLMLIGRAEKLFWILCGKVLSRGSCWFSSTLSFFLIAWYYSGALLLLGTECKKRRSFILYINFPLLVTICSTNMMDILANIAANFL